MPLSCLRKIGDGCGHQEQLPTAPTDSEDEVGAARNSWGRYGDLYCSSHASFLGCLGGWRRVDEGQPTQCRRVSLVRRVRILARSATLAYFEDHLLCLDQLATLAFSTVNTWRSWLVTMPSISHW